MEYYLYILLGATIVALDLGAMATVLLEDILYSGKVKFFKILFILFIPLIGAIRELYVLRKFNKKKHTPSGNSNDIAGYGGGEM